MFVPEQNVINIFWYIYRIESFRCYQMPYWPKCNLAKNLLFEGLNKSSEESKRHYWDNKPSLIELCKQRLLLYQSLEANSKKKNAKKRYDSVLFVFKNLYANMKQRNPFCSFIWKAKKMSDNYN